MLSASPAPQVRISSRIAAWFLGTLIISSLSLIVVQIVSEPLSPPQPISQVVIAADSIK